MMEHKRKNELSVAAGLVANMGVRAGMRRAVHYVVEAVRDGKVLWVDEFDNLVVNVGLDDNLDKHFKGSGYTAAWYVGLTAVPLLSGPAAACSAPNLFLGEGSFAALTREVLTLG